MSICPRSGYFLTWLSAWIAEAQIDTVDAAIKILGRINTENLKNTKSKRKMSTASRRKMSLAAKKRWAEKKKAK